MEKIIRKHVGERASKIVIYNKTVHLCGQVGVPDTPLQDQAKEMLSRVDTLLEEAGTDKSHMLSATVYLSDIKYFAEFNKIWDVWVTPNNTPARTCVEARLMHPALFCEVTIVAALP